MRSFVPGRGLAVAALASLLQLGFVAPASAQAADGAVKVSATLSSSRIAAGESTVLQIAIETSGEGAEAIDVPRLEPGLEVTSSQEFSQLQVGYPGGRSRLIRRDLIVRAHLAGSYMIPEVSVTVGGTTYRTRPITLFVEQPRNQPSRVPGRAGDEVLLRAWVEPDTVYVGQQVLLHAEALFPRDLRQRQSRPAAYEAPTPPDFWIQDLPSAVSTGVRSIDGVVFQTQTFRRAYFPLSAGRFMMPPARLTYEVRRGFLYAPEGRELISDSLPIVVLPVPQAGRPGSFSGAVGRFEIAARIEPEALDVGEAATLTVEITGSGNVKALPPPKLPELSGVELFPPTEDAQVDVVDDELRGVKRFTWVLLPEHAGRLELPIEYAFFDPERDRFDVARADPLSLRVTGDGVAAASSNSAAILRPVALEPASRWAEWVRSPAFVLLQVVPLVALLGGVVLRRNSGAIRGRRMRGQLRQAHEKRFAALLGAAASAGSEGAFFSELNVAIRVAIAELLAQPDLGTASRAELLTSLRAHGLTERTATGLDALFGRMDRARFAGTDAGRHERAAIVAEGKRLIERIRGDLEPAGGGSTLAGAIALLCLFAPTTSVYAQTADADFAEGVNAFHGARYTDAASAFTAYVQQRPHDANGWYNLGNAYMREQQRGHAVWAWLRALEIEPRHAAARHNLAVAAPAEAIGVVPTSIRLPRTEAAFALAVVWWVAGCTLAVLIATRSRAAVRVAIGAVSLMIVVAALALPSALHARTAIALGESNLLLAGPAHHSEPLANLRDGSPVTILERRGDWWRVREPHGREGWVEAAFFGEV